MGTKPAWTCAACVAATGTKRYCAPTRCYCGHPGCPAFDSWVDLKALAASEQYAATPTPRSSTWDDREEATWIDQL